MKLRYFALIFILLTWVKSELKAQDPEFSQFYAAPVHLNPAMIGFAEEPRLSLNYRHQYPSFGQAYLTLGVSYDQHFHNLNSSIGLSILADRAGGGLYNSYLISGIYAYQLAVGENMFMKFGVQASYLQQYINWADLVFTDMLNPLTGAVIGSTGELMPEQTGIHRFDLSGGFALFSDKFYGGASFKHITAPNLSFYDDANNANILNLRISAHAGYTVYFGPVRRNEQNWYASPNLLVVNQGKFLQFTGGGYIGKGPLFGGLWYRHTISNPDALIVLLGVKAGIFKVGYSYDFNVSKLNTSAGTHEVSLVFDLSKTRYASDKVRRRDTYTCPEIFNF